MVGKYFNSVGKSKEIRDILQNITKMLKQIEVQYECNGDLRTSISAVVGKCFNSFIQ